MNDASGGHLSGRDYYSDLYRAELADEAEWLRYGAIEKANSVEFLLRVGGFEPHWLLELGCGTGAVILECQRRGLAAQYTAIDYSPEAIRYLMAVSQGIECQVADITSPAFRAPRNVDLVLLSHVIEHLEDPRAFLREVLKQIPAKKFILEVPLEDLLASRLKNRFRNRMNNKAGHVQFFTATSFRDLLRSVGLIIERERQYVPTWTEEVLRLMMKRDSLTTEKKLLKRLTQRQLPQLLRPVWQRWYYAHFAVLCSLPPDQHPVSLDS